MRASSVARALILVLCIYTLVACGRSSDTRPRASLLGINPHLTSGSLKVRGTMPRFSADNKLVIFGGSGKANIYALDLSEQKQTKLSSNVWDQEPCWIPGTDDFVFASYGTETEGQEFQIWRFSGKTTTLRRLLNFKSKQTEQYPLVSPSGDFLVFSDTYLELTSPNGEVPIQLTNGKSAFDVGCDWSRDSKRVLFLRTPEYSPEGRIQICEIHSDGSNMKILLERTLTGASQVSAIAWARYTPDGNGIYYSDFNRLYYLPEGASRPRQIFEDAACEQIGEFDLSTDGKYFVYQRGHERSIGEIVVELIAERASS